MGEALDLLEKYGDPSEEGFDDARQALVAVLIKEGKHDDARRFWKDGDAPLPPPPSAAAPPKPRPPSAVAPPKPKPPPNPFDREPWESPKEKQ